MMTQQGAAPMGEITPESAPEDQIAEARAACHTTRRATAPKLEEQLYGLHPVLDHGFVRVVDYMGDDQAIVQAARVSYGKGTKSRRSDAGLIRYLMRHRHTTPFEMCEIKFHVKLPLFVARQWIRHRTASVNEYSGRYSLMEDAFYVPERAQLAAQSISNRQGRGALLSGEEADEALELLSQEAQTRYQHYLRLLNQDETGQKRRQDRDGLSRELARMTLPLSVYTQMYWKIDLHNLLHFLSLRVEAHAQYEIRVYAQTMLNLVQAWVPLAYQAFMDYRMGGTSLSAGALAAVRARLRGEAPTAEACGLSAREWEELTACIPELAEPGL